jgi:diguanylate cyclase
MDVLAQTANPADIAREAIRQLVAFRIAPTPENFARAYSEASGGSADMAGHAEAEQVLSHVVELIASRCPGLGSASQLQEQVRQRAWSSALKLVDDTVGEALVEPAREWPQLLQQLMTQLDSTHAEWTRARKLGALQHVLASSADGRTFEKLQQLMTAWAQTAKSSPGVQVAAHSDSDGEMPCAVVRSEIGTSPRGATDHGLEVKAWRLLALTALDVYQPSESGPRDAATGNTADTLGARLAKFAGVPGAEWQQEIKSACTATQAEISRQAAFRERLVKLLRLLCENLALFADDDAWVNGQVARITELLESPFDERALAEAEDSLHAAVKRQSALMAELRLAKTAVKVMLASLIDHLSTAATSTDEFHRRIGNRAEAIKQADDLPSLSRVVANLLDDAVEMREGMQKAHKELSDARETAQRHEARVHALETELVEVSSMVRIDPLTQALNRRGLEDAMAVAQSRANRDGAPLAVALLDIDNFKHLNDAFGHQTGDKALKHVTDMVRNALRPGDTVARYGGEEFVILLPGTSLAEGVNVMKRAQRQLTRNFFLHNNEKILITFSVGIADYRPGESQASVIKRADDAVYVAKASGKNRVHAA